MKDSVPVFGSLTNTWDVLASARYSFPSDPTQVPLCFAPLGSPIPSRKDSVSVSDSTASAREAFDGSLHRFPSDPAQIPLGLSPPCSPAPSKKDSGPVFGLITREDEHEKAGLSME